MAYIRPPTAVRAGRGLIQTPSPSPLAPLGTVSVILDADIATTSTLGVIKVGSGLTISVDGTLTATGSSGTITGVWTPTIISSLGATISLNVRDAMYTKTGQSVFCTFDVEVLAEAGGGNNGILSISGLPFTSLVSSGYVGSVFISYFANLDSETSYISGSVVSNSNRASLWQSTSNVKTLPAMLQDDIKVSSRLVGTIQYISAP